MYFCNFVIIAPLKKGVDKLESPSSMNALRQVWLKMTQLILKRRYLNFVHVFPLDLFHYYVLLEKDVALHMNKLEFPSLKDALCQIWLKLV